MGYRRCIVEGCESSYHDPRRSLFTLPSDDTRCTIWIQRLNLNITLEQLKIKQNARARSNHLVVCDLHFHTNQFPRSNNRTRLKKGAVPSIIKPLERRNDGGQSKKRAFQPKTSAGEIMMVSKESNALITPFSSTSVSAALLPPPLTLTMTIPMMQTMSLNTTTTTNNNMQIPRTSTLTLASTRLIPEPQPKQHVQVQSINQNQPTITEIYIPKPSGKCRYCDKVFDDAAYVEPHEEKWHKKYTCRICNKVTASSQKAIDNHIKRDHNFNPKTNMAIKKSATTNKPERASLTPLVVVKEEDFEESEIQIIGYESVMNEEPETDPLELSPEPQNLFCSENLQSETDESSNEFSNTINQSNTNLQQNVQQQPESDINSQEDIRQTLINKQQNNSSSLLQQQPTTNQQQKNVTNLFQNIQNLSQLPPGTLICLDPGPSKKTNPQDIAFSSITNITAITNIVNLPPPPPVLVQNVSPVEKVPDFKSRISNITNIKLGKLQKEKNASFSDDTDSVFDEFKTYETETDSTTTNFVCNYDYHDIRGKCNSKFDTMIELETHASALHTNFRIYLQNISKYAFKSKVSKQYKCDLCLLSFTKFSLFENHKFFDHQVNKNEESYSDFNYPYRCVRKNCGRSFTEFDDFEKHASFHLALEDGLI